MTICWVLLQRLWLGSRRRCQSAHRVTLDLLPKWGALWFLSLAERSLWGTEDNTQVRTTSWVWNWGMPERKRSKPREQASDIGDSSWDLDKTRHFVLIKNGTEMCCNKSHTRAAESVGCTLDSDEFFHFKPAQPANLCFSLHWLLCSYLCSKKKKALNGLSVSLSRNSSPLNNQKPIRVNEK